MVVALSIWLLRRRRKRAKSLDVAREMEEEFEEGTGPKQFRYGELVMATDNFSDKKKLGEGGFGSVYRGFLKEMNLHVAIKRVSKTSHQGRKEYVSEVRTISRLDPAPQPRAAHRLVPWRRRAPPRLRADAQRQRRHTPLQ
jgi:serine/threonine protein kinase